MNHQRYCKTQIHNTLVCQLKNLMSWVFHSVQLPEGFEQSLHLWPRIESTHQDRWVGREEVAKHITSLQKRQINTRPVLFKVMVRVRNFPWHASKQKLSSQTLDASQAQQESIPETQASIISNPKRVVALLYCRAALVLLRPRVETVDGCKAEAGSHRSSDCKATPCS